MDSSTALVTGAAGGIGAAVARSLAERGTPVVAADLDADALEKTTAELGADGLHVTAAPADVTDAGAVEELVDDVENRIGPIRFLVNAAGVLRPGEVRALSEHDWASTFAVNATGVFHVSRSVSERMIGRGSGAIVTVASNAARTPRAGMAAYAASKAAAALFTKSLGVELARHGIRCNVVAPGSTDTSMLSSLWHDDSDRDKTISGDRETFRLGIPLGKLALPADIAAAVAFLLSDEASHITLHDLTVDGGATLGV